MSKWKLGLPPVGIHDQGEKPPYNARHNFGWIRVRAAGRTIVGSLAQDKWEWAFLRLVGIPFYLLAAVPLFLGCMNLAGGFDNLEWGHWYVSLVPPLAPYVYGPRWMPGVRRFMELRGHMIEAVVAEQRYGKRLIPYVRKEAGELIDNHSLFKIRKGDSYSSEAYRAVREAEIDTVAAEMLMHKGKAERWVEWNNWRIDRWMNWFPKPEGV